MQQNMFLFLSKGVFFFKTTYFFITYIDLALVVASDRKDVHGIDQ